MKKAALVTGGTRGIGLGIARGLAREGYDLALCGTRAEAAVAQTLSELSGLGGKVLYFQADIGEREARVRLVQEVRKHFQELHLLVNNAGVGPKERKDILEASEESFERVLRINLQGPYFLTQAIATWMIEQKKTVPGFTGCIINITSVSASAASVNRGEYCISKAGLAMASQLWAVRLAGQGIPVYEVRPGIIRTDMTAGVRSSYDKRIAEGLLLQERWGTPEDVGKAVVMLARGDLAYSTGQVVMVDGGFAVGRL
jgi:NAD(P)-dependent dehydrogenase (short-subunit alcohol dehydrogenase family)